MRFGVVILLLLVQFTSKAQSKFFGNDLFIGDGQMPSVSSGSNDDIHVAFGKGDSIMYASSIDGGKSFNSPVCVDTIANLVAFATRGPQVVVTKETIAIVALNQDGDIFSYTRPLSGKWTRGTRVNDTDTIAKEGFVSISNDGIKNVFAVWLDLRGNRRNKIYGALSADGGKTWGSNKLIYASVDSTVCECCKPSVAVSGNKVYVMFRNWLNGNRDLYLIQSNDGGKTFGEAVKLGIESWALNGCPMDGGDIAVNDKGGPETVWRRKNTIYSCSPGQQEVAIGEGRSCVMESVNGKSIYGWIENGKVVILKPGQVRQVMGEGSSPVITSTGKDQALCVWENEKQIHSSIIKL